ncbi:MAG: acyl-CoA dehydrogenase family protein [Ilumatobacteraceae bacterium]|jgi:alkylation response protein AidB-like acyl-CoA dehydrogenase|nr:acyl-CoA dehydrogenase family protein [Actinomycetota bacterium]MDA3012665.1 acyl-CoA dehydrogenase family protein [Actinomycetota bacterium]MDA3025620.1 acyl-CoA dehydrogenase family protein [Actinomycetota bacterium]
MELSYPADAEEFRQEIRTWLETNLPKGWGQPGFEMSAEERKAFNETWPSKLFEGGWICATWPTEYGGKGLTTMQGVVLSEEFARMKAPLRADFFGDTLVGPTLLQWGTEEQKKEFLPNILNGKTRWCQGFSEPNSGSDLASLKTTAVLDGDEWVINGQKVWTTGGHHADYCFLLTRTDPDATKHKGISYLLVPMRQDGVEVRGIVQPDGTAEFCEVFFTDARCPKDNVVGGVNNGWKVANSTLAFERGMSATTGYRRFEEEYRLMKQTATENGSIEHEGVRQRLMRYYTKIQILRINGLRSLTATLNGSKDLGVMALGATNKMFWSEMHKEAMELALDIFGAESMLVDAGASASWPGVARERRRSGYPVSPMMSAFFFSRSETIWGGTSQIQRNIVSERVLGLPKEPSPS